MSQGKRFVVASKTDPLSIIRLGGVLDALRAIHPRSQFIDYRDCRAGKESKHGRSELHRNIPGLIAMLAKGEVDIVVTDARDIPLRLHSSASIAAVLERGNPYDVFLSGEDVILDDQPQDACIAASDPVKAGQLLYYRPDLAVVEDTAGFDSLYRKMKNGDINGFVMAASDVEAFHMQNKVAEVFTASVCTPVAGQGALGLLMRTDDKAVQAILKELDDPSSSAELELERMFLEQMHRKGKGLFAVLANVESDGFSIEASITARDGSEKVLGSLKGTAGGESKTVAKLIDELFAAGGEHILRQSRGSQEV